MEGMHPPSAPPQRGEIFSWLVLASLGLRLRHAPIVQELGGPAAVLQLPASRFAGAFDDVRRFQRAPPDEPARAGAYDNASAALRWLHEGDGRVMPPSELACLADARSSPLVLFARGSTALLAQRPSLAIVGSRAATPRGIGRARAVAEAAARAGVVVVSGGALGIDLAAHESALSTGGATVVVLGDAVRAGRDERPMRVCDLGRLGRERLLTLTPHGPWAPQDKRLWASRNAVIATLADAVLVVEGRPRSGTLHTADAARRLGRPLLAVPGDPDDEVAAAPNRLLRDGVARPLLRPEDALAAVDAVAVSGSDETERRPDDPSLPEDQRALLRALGPRGARVDVEELADRLALHAPALFGTVLQLELRGLVRREGSSLLRLG